MALTITPQFQTTLGHHRKSPMFSRGPRPLVFKVYEADMDTTNYASDGEPITSITGDDFGEILYVGIEQKDTNTAADKREFNYDYANQKILFYSAFNTEASGDQGVVALRILVVGTIP
jgi:hypothetical protein